MDVIAGIYKKWHRVPIMTRFFGKKEDSGIRSHVDMKEVEEEIRSNCTRQLITTLNHEFVHLFQLASNKGISSRVNNLKEAAEKIKKRLEEDKAANDENIKKAVSKRDYALALRYAVSNILFRTHVEGTAEFLQYGKRPMTSYKAYLIHSQKLASKINESIIKLAKEAMEGKGFVGKKIPSLNEKLYTYITIRVDQGHVMGMNIVATMFDEYCEKHEDKENQNIFHELPVDYNYESFAEELIKLKTFEFFKRYEQSCKHFGIQPLISIDSGEGIIDYNRLLKQLWEIVKEHE